ncbi:hypothetical protein A0J61_05714 [Choanephora cucurbitarum]|uniref:Uncharacterized protein n=1 Tax=Choanephora cucurbitarum TaxID=101091 RepID=A0A1C7NFU6_9FUNG|nr:hypothetical protein A0J61_05714 [Choanephora cucurbitarum]
MDNVQHLEQIPDFVRIEAQRLSSSLNLFRIEPQNISYNITAGDFNVINTFNGEDPSPSTNSAESYDEEEDKIASDLSIHHPQRTCRLQSSSELGNGLGSLDTVP